MRLAVSTATCRPLNFATKQSNARRSGDFTQGSLQQLCGVKGLCWFRKTIHLSFCWLLCIPQPHFETKSDHVVSEGKPDGIDQKCPYTASVRISPLSCSRQQAMDSNEWQKASATNWYCAWEQSRDSKVLVGRLKTWKKNKWKLPLDNCKNISPNQVKQTSKYFIFSHITCPPKRNTPRFLGRQNKEKIFFPEWWLQGQNLIFS